MTHLTASFAIGALFGAAFALPALAKDAYCFTTDDGYYDCQFETTDGDGSFEISAPGYPSFALVMDSPGTAYGFGVFEPGGRSVSLPGVYVRSQDDGACWVNSDTETHICAW